MKSKKDKQMKWLSVSKHFEDLNKFLMMQVYSISDSFWGASCVKYAHILLMKNKKIKLLLNQSRLTRV